MGSTVRFKKLKIGDHITEAFNDRDMLLLRNYWIHNKEDLKRLKKLNVTHASISTGHKKNITPEKNIAAKFIEKQIDKSETQIRQTQVVYRNTIGKIKEVFEHVREKLPVEPKSLFPFINSMIDYANESPASISFLTQIEEYDFDTFRHSVNVGILAILYGRHHNFGHQELVRIAYGAMLHDIGKIFIPENIITKHDRLSGDEYDIVKMHPEWGYEALNDLAVEEPLLRIAYEHHERPGGHGYPDGKVDIHPYSRLISVFDVYDALTSKRVYKDRVTPNRAFLTLSEEFGGFPETKQIIHDLLRCIGLYPVGCLVQLTNGEIGVVHRNHYKDLLHPTVCIIFDEYEREIDRPYLVDLQQIQDHKSLHNNRFYDYTVKIESVLSLDHVSTIGDDDIFATFDRLEKRAKKRL